jgi:hypothetical protein
MKEWTTPCELDPELAACVYDDGPFGAMLKHKFVNEPMYMPQMNARYNTVLCWKRQHTAEALADKQWHTFIFLHERPWRLEALLELTELVDDTTYWGLVGDVWSDSENIHENFDEWDELLRYPRPGREAMMDDEERAALADMDDVITVYRGFEQDLNEEGWSWTTDRRKAAWFARRFAQEDDCPSVLVGEVNKGAVLAYLMGRGESEVIVAPEAVRVRGVFSAHG